MNVWVSQSKLEWTGRVCIAIEARGSSPVTIMRSPACGAWQPELSKLSKFKVKLVRFHTNLLIQLVFSIFKRRSVGYRVRAPAESNAQSSELLSSGHHLNVLVQLVV